MQIAKRVGTGASFFILTLLHMDLFLGNYRILLNNVRGH